MIIEAEIVDSTHLRLLQPVEVEVGAKITLEIIEPEREEFLNGGASNLERAYGDDEPDYSTAGTPIHS